MDVRLLDRILDMIAPPSCAVCEGPLPAGLAVGVCEHCAKAYPSWLCSPVDGVDGRLACGPLDGALRHAIHRLKYGGEVWRGEGLGHWMAGRCWPDGVGPGECAVVVPVPMDLERRRARGFNQAEILAQAVAFAADLPLAPALLERVRTAERLAGSGRETRRRVLGSYTVTADEVPSEVLLVDDVTTTGSTLEACSEALRRAGVRSVHALCAAGADVLAPTLAPGQGSATDWRSAPGTP